MHKVGDLRLVITIDTDWAPDWCTEWLLNKISFIGTDITIFVTNKSAFYKSISNAFEVGLHPDFSRNNPQESFLEFIKLRDYYPDALGMRSHRNIFGQNIANYANDLKLKYDISTLLYNCPTPAWRDQNGMMRFSYSWEDGVYLEMKEKYGASEIYLQENGLPTIINLHPVLMYLNSNHEGHRRQFTSSFSDLTKVSKEEANTFRNNGFGISNFVVEFLEQSKSENAIFQKVDTLVYKK